MRDAGVATTSRAMFGGHGLYADGVFFAIVDDDVLYLRVDARNRAEFEALGCTPFEYPTKEGVHQAMSYLCAPDEALERPDAMGRWAALVARRGVARRGGEETEKDEALARRNDCSSSSPCWLR
jgi:DNA transformation protein